MRIQYLEVDALAVQEVPGGKAGLPTTDDHHIAEDPAAHGALTTGSHNARAASSASST